jgi:hypothetical protein
MVRGRLPRVSNGTALAMDYDLIVMAAMAIRDCGKRRWAV